jgi:atypical dual specificity phosphatase
MLKNNIQTVISVIDLQPPDLRQYNIQQHWFPIRDSVFSEISVLFPETFSILSQAIQRGENVLVHCAQGISRSVTIIVAFLLNCLTKKPEWIVPFIPEVSGENKTARILEFIRDKRPIINPNKYFVRLLKRLEHDSI